MLSVDKYAYTNRLKDINPVEKISFSLITLLLCLIFNSINAYFFVIVTMSITIVYIARIPLLDYLKMLLIPFPFLLISIITIIININPESFLYGFRVYSIEVGITSLGLIKGQYIFWRALACISCMYFLALTTSIVEITIVLNKVKLPIVFIEMITIIYRFIFVLLETAINIKLSQECRLGYSSIKKSYYSLGILVTNLFLKSYQRYKMLYLSLISRGYTGELNVLHREYRISLKNIGIIALYIVLLLIIAINFGGDYFDEAYFRN